MFIDRRPPPAPHTYRDSGSDGSSFHVTGDWLTHERKYHVRDYVLTTNDIHFAFLIVGAYGSSDHTSDRVVRSDVARLSSHARTRVNGRTKTPPNYGGYVRSSPDIPVACFTSGAPCFIVEGRFVARGCRRTLQSHGSNKRISQQRAPRIRRGAGVLARHATEPRTVLETNISAGAWVSRPASTATPIPVLGDDTRGRVPAR